MSDAVIDLACVTKEYHGAGGCVTALREVSLRLGEGERIAVLGASGCGKSTLLHVIGCLERASAGQYRFDGRDVTRLADTELSRLRREAFGFVFQRFHLIQELTVFENVELPVLYRGMPAPQRRRRALEALEAVGLGDRARERPGNLSGGQQQRVAIARAVVGCPRVILADEPTGNLDSRSSAQVLDLLLAAHATMVGAVLVLVTHNLRLTAGLDRIVVLRDGCVESDGPADRHPAAGPQEAGGAGHTPC